VSVTEKGVEVVVAAHQDKQRSSICGDERGQRSTKRAAVLHSGAFVTDVKLTQAGVPHKRAQKYISCVHVDTQARVAQLQLCERSVHAQRTCHQRCTSRVEQRNVGL
jgi:hypothetical protein